ncbi:hypothetical protein NDU88_008574 [Pleurodeles waltl]|uniref:Uncharacterized protein n=1 Tax=Pleurodeles waltl TaxID=8319 RepID=A0AAV7RSS5_PLEWA|nr:hypothetical protein NDU88_008574 [Pleurodeles waltl]
MHRLCFRTGSRSSVQLPTWKAGLSARPVRATLSSTRLLQRLRLPGHPTQRVTGASQQPGIIRILGGPAQSSSSKRPPS